MAKDDVQISISGPENSNRIRTCCHRVVASDIGRLELDIEFRLEENDSVVPAARLAWLQEPRYCA